MRDTLVVAVSVTLLFALLLAAGLTFPDWKPYVLGAEPPVSVFVIGSAEAVQKLREVIAPERILVSTPEAIVLQEGRVIAASAEAVGEPLTAIGWIDRELEIVSVGPAEEAPPGGAGTLPASGFGAPADAGPLDAEEEQGFARLVRKPTLTWRETHELLRYMERSGQL
ncbi:MAG: hypothetical protein JRG96_18760 [Deltaproteobacteria bacterium]|nr:hypothetical protein [Deltaproteobacteria bacterium]